MICSSILLSCNGHTQDKKNNTIILKNNDENEFYIGKKYYSDEELVNYSFVKSIETNIDSIYFYLYKNRKSRNIVATLNKFISNEDVERFEITDVIKIDSNSDDNIHLERKMEDDNFKLILYNNGDELKSWSFKNTQKLPLQNNNKTEFNKISQTLNFIITPIKFKEDTPNVPTQFKIEIENKQNSKILDEIYFTPDYLFSGISDNDGVSYINEQVTKESIEQYHKFIVGDFNFDNKEDFAIINYEGNNAGPQYSYYIQNNSRKFLVDTLLTNTMKFFPKKINTDDKNLTISHLVGCCVIRTDIIKLQSDGQWKEIFSESKNMSNEQ